MSEDSTQQLLVARVNQLISIVEPISGQISNLEKHVNERLDRIEEQQTEFGARLDRFEKQQTEFGARLDRVEKQQTEFGKRLDRFEKQQTEFGARLDRFEEQQTEFGAKLDGLDTKVDQRLRETRPIWESVLSQLAELHKEVDGLRADTASGFRAVDRKIGVVSKNMVDMTADLQELRGVIEKLESQPA